MKLESLYYSEFIGDIIDGKDIDIDEFKSISNLDKRFIDTERLFIILNLFHNEKISFNSFKEFIKIEKLKDTNYAYSFIECYIKCYCKYKPFLFDLTEFISIFKMIYDKNIVINYINSSNTSTKSIDDLIVSTTLFFNILKKDLISKKFINDYNLIGFGIIYILSLTNNTEIIKEKLNDYITDSLCELFYDINEINFDFINLNMNTFFKLSLINDYSERDQELFKEVTDLFNDKKLLGKFILLLKKGYV